MTFGRCGLVCGMVVVMAVSACSTSGGGDDGSRATGNGPTSAGPSSASATSRTTPITGGTAVTDGAATFDLPPGVSFVEAPPTVREDAHERTWRYAPDPASALCVVTLAQQPTYAQPFPENERQLFRARIQQLQGGKILVDEDGAGPGGAAAGWVTHHVTPANPAAGTTKAVAVWTRTYLTPGKGLVQLAAAASEDQAQTCQIDKIVGSLGWTGVEVVPAAPSDSASPPATPTGTAGSA